MRAVWAETQIISDVAQMNAASGPPMRAMSQSRKAKAKMKAIQSPNRAFSWQSQETKSASRFPKRRPLRYSFR